MNDLMKDQMNDLMNEPIRTKGVRYTIKDGIVYDAQELLSDVRRLVAEAKADQE